MTRLIAVILFCAGIFCLGQSHAQVPMTGAGLGKPASGGASPTWTATGNPASQNTGTTSATFTSVGIGSPAASDVLVANFDSESTVASGITCNGNAMTKQVEESSTISGLQIWSITASACGVTGTATTTFVASAGGSMNNEVLQVGKLTGVNSTPTTTGTAASGTSIGVTVPSTGFAIIGAYASPGIVVSWTGGTQDFATNVPASDNLYLVHTQTTGTVSETGVTSGNIHFVYVAWGP